MSHSLKPVTGEWYRHLDKGQPFRVVNIEDDDKLIEIQTFDGDLEEVEITEWFAMDLEPAAAPEDWTGPMDDIETDDLGYEDTAMTDTDWRASLDYNKGTGDGGPEAAADDGTDSGESSDEES